MAGTPAARARWLLMPACVLAAKALAVDEAAAIPFRAADESLGRQAGLAIGVTLVLLALAATLLLALRRRFAATAPARGDALRCIASLRLPPQTRVHLIAYRDREWLLVQAGERVRCLPAGAVHAEVSAAATEANARPWDAS